MGGYFTMAIISQNGKLSRGARHLAFFIGAVLATGVFACLVAIAESV